MEITRGTLEFLGLKEILKTYDKWLKTRSNVTILYKKERIILKSKCLNKKLIIRSFFI